MLDGKNNGETYAVKNTKTAPTSLTRAATTHKLTDVIFLDPTQQLRFKTDKFDIEIPPRHKSVADSSSNTDRACGGRAASIEQIKTKNSLK